MINQFISSKKNEQTVIATIIITSPVIRKGKKIPCRICSKFSFQNGFRKDSLDYKIIIHNQREQTWLCKRERERVLSFLYK